MTDCIFCRIVANELHSSGVADDESVIAFLDIKPINPGHTLVVPVRHAPFLADLAQRK
jgi:histidine triad (HIT) family protein